MAGDLLIVDMSFETKETFMAAGATLGTQIFHCDKSWSSNHANLEGRLALAGPANRVGLPAHAYITFFAANRQNVAQYCADKVQKAKLNNHLVKLSRPLGVVSANPNLGAWSGAGWDGAANLLLAALQAGNVVIEYYKQDRSPIVDVFGSKRDWARVPE